MSDAARIENDLGSVDRGRLLAAACLGDPAPPDLVSVGSILEQALGAAGERRQTARRWSGQSLTRDMPQAISVHRSWIEAYWQSQEAGLSEWSRTPGPETESALVRSLRRYAASLPYRELVIGDLDGAVLGRERRTPRELYYVVVALASAAALQLPVSELDLAGDVWDHQVVQKLATGAIPVGLIGEPMTAAAVRALSRCVGNLESCTDGPLLELLGLRLLSMAWPGPSAESRRVAQLLPHRMGRVFEDWLKESPSSPGDHDLTTWVRSWLNVLRGEKAS